MSEPSKPTSPDVSTIFADLQRRKRPIQERPPDSLRTRLRTGIILGLLFGLSYGVAETYLSDVWFQSPWLNLMIGIVTGVVLGLLNAYPTSGISGIAASSTTYALFVIVRTIFSRCSPYFIFWLNTEWVIIIIASLAVGLFLAGMIPLSLLRWSITEQREYFDRPSSSIERSRPVILMLIAAGIAGWSIPFIISLMGLCI